MSFGTNLQYLRKLTGLTQEKLSERLHVSRQTVSRWETDDIFPEMPKLLELCDLFSCKLDALVREDLSALADIYSPITIRRVKGFRMARYVMISPNCEEDVQSYLRAWAERSGLSKWPEEKRPLIGWDFPFVSPEQKNRFNLRGYVAAWVLPEDFHPDCPGVEYAIQEDADYAVITITEPFRAPFESIPTAYRLVLDYLGANGFRETPRENVLSCFEREYRRDGVTYMDVYLHVDSVGKADLFTSFS